MTKSRIKKSRKRAMLRGVIAVGRSCERHIKGLLRDLGLVMTIEVVRTN